MTDKKSKRPPVDSPEFDEWLMEQTAKDVNSIFGDNHKPSEFDERGVLSGSADLLDKTDAELFPDELEEYTPEERRKLFKLHKKDDKKKDDDKTGDK